MDSINSRIRHRREELGLALETIAAELGISYQAVQQWEREGGTTPRRKRMGQLAGLLKTSPEWLEFGPRETYDQTSNISAREPSPETISPPWPFKLVTLSRVRSLSQHELGYVEGRLLAAIEECESARPSKDRRAG